MTFPAKMKLSINYSLSNTLTLCLKKYSNFSCKLYDVLLCQPNGKQSVPHRVSNPERCSAFRQNQAGTLRTGIPSGNRRANANIRAIVDNTEAPDFENVIVAFDNSSPILNRVSAIFFNMTDAETSDALNELSIKLAPVLSNMETIYRLTRRYSIKYRPFTRKRIR